MRCRTPLTRAGSSREPGRAPGAPVVAASAHPDGSARGGGAGLISGRKAFQKPTSEGVKLLNAIQDVFLSDEVTIA